MITTRFYLDSRQAKPGNASPLKIVLTKNGVRSLISTGISILPSQWDNNRQIVVGHSRKQQLNAMLAERKVTVDNILYRLMTEGEVTGLKASEIRRRVEWELYPDIEHKLTFISRFDAYASTRTVGTQRVYHATRRRLEAYLGNNLDSLTFEQMDVAWLRKFDAFLAKTSPARNARNIHFRNIRTVFNDALADEVIVCYPFRKFKLIPEFTRKRSLSIEKLREVFNMEDLKPHEQRYLDCFKLIFMLCGINIVDLCRLNRNCVVDGCVEYERAKTHRLYYIRLEPEAQEIMRKYAGKEWLLNYHDGCKSYRAFYQRLCKTLQDIGARLGIGELTTYWARHSWATIAASLDIPKETIAATLGHGGNTVTDIYIDFDRRKVDEANRRVIDYVLHGIEPR